LFSNKYHSTRLPFRLYEHVYIFYMSSHNLPKVM